MTASGPPVTRGGRWMMVLTGIVVTLVVLALARLSFGVLLPYMRDGLGLTYRAAGNLGTVTALGYLSTVMLAGVVARRWGPRRAVLLGVTLVTAGFLGVSVVTEYAWLVLLMAALGVGTAFTYTPFIALLAAWFPDRRGLVIGLATSGVGLGMFLVGIVVPYLARALGEDGWRAAWGVFALLGLVAVVLVAVFVRNPPNSGAQAGTAPDPAKPRSEVYRNGRVVTVGLLYGIIGVSYIVQTIFMVSFMLDVGVSAVMAGRLVALNGLLSVVSGVVWGWLSDRLGRGTSLVLSMSTVLLAMAAPVAWPVLPVFALHYVVLGCTLTGVFTLVQAAGTEQVQGRDVPLALSYVTLFFAAGQFVGPAFAGWMIDQTGGFRLVFALVSAVLVLGLLLTLRIRRFSAVGSGGSEASQQGRESEQQKI